MYTKSSEPIAQSGNHVHVLNGIGHILWRSGTPKPDAERAIKTSVAATAGHAHVVIRSRPTPASGQPAGRIRNIGAVYARTARSCVPRSIVPIQYPLPHTARQIPMVPASISRRMAAYVDVRSPAVVIITRTRLIHGRVCASPRIPAILAPSAAAYSHSASVGRRPPSHPKATLTRTWLVLLSAGTRTNVPMFPSDHGPYVTAIGSVGSGLGPALITTLPLGAFMIDVLNSSVASVGFLQPTTHAIAGIHPSRFSPAEHGATIPPLSRPAFFMLFAGIAEALPGTQEASPPLPNHRFHEFERHALASSWIVAQPA